MPTYELADLWAAIAQSPISGLAATVVCYGIAMAVQRRFGGTPLLHPTLCCILALGVVIWLTGWRYGDYMAGGQLINVMLGPAVVLLAVPLFQQAALIKAAAPRLLAGLAVGLPLGIASALAFAWACGAAPELARSLAPKSVTAGIAVEISGTIGGLPSVTAVLVIMTGIVGAIAGPAAARLAGVRELRAVGFAMGIASHGIGTSRALQIDKVSGACASLGMGVNGVATALLLPLVADRL